MSKKKTAAEKLVNAMEVIQHLGGSTSEGTQGSASGLLTAEQVLCKMEEYCEQIGNQALAKVLREGYRKTGEMAPAILRTFDLEPVTMWKPKARGTSQDS